MSNRRIGNKNSKRNIIIIILLLLLAVTSVITIVVIKSNNDEKESDPVILAPDYAPQEEEENAEPIEDDVEGEKLQQQQGGGAVSITYSKNVSIDLSENTVSLLFANPSKSNQDMMIQLVVQDTVIVQSGLLTPGHQVKKLELFDNVKLSSGTYDAKIVVLYYQKDTGEKAMINTQIPLTLTVEE